MYTKYTYWMQENTFHQVKQSLEDRQITLKEASKTVCIPLSPKISFGYVPPEAWTRFELCRRQLFWYRESKFAGQFLLIADHPLADFGFNLTPETIIQKTGFKPPSLPGRDRTAIQKLAESPAFQSQCPQEFIDISAMDKDQQARWLKIMGIRGITYADLLVDHCANHANFISPQYFVKEKNKTIPYSIGKTKKMCSACLEFFNIIGDAYHKKHIVPCPGAALFAGMAVNKYYQVQTP